MGAAIDEAETATQKAHSALADAQTFIAKKLVELTRFADGPGKVVREEVDMLQKRLEEGRDRPQRSSLRQPKVWR